ncbi:hypothetical protein CEY16_01055 [Halalkalibacillus sediminis]|uniref:Carboxyltransferase domain-containing protein n=1 Tax=Halalkalibacillus sediminis TaxID=2018042 RepID=A0A2I0QVM2_9BACI|nr:biotin-dependent carboxyltransferase family protein [Halalkalibacillus sediminis]PKR78376.1 hypothetical protein CEY16_01055 [Halalkalibacillus sediminis]
MLKVIKAGVYASVQDHGRLHYRAFGVPTSGAMDQYAFKMANKIIGNQLGEAVIEITMGGTSFEALDDVDISITGADLKATVDDEAVDIWQVISLKKGQNLAFKGPEAGLRSYIAFPGGIDAPEYMGSKSVYEKAGLGEVLGSGDIIVSNEQKSLDHTHVGLQQIPTYTKETTVNVIPSIHETLFEDESVKLFYNEAFTLKQGDRMGALLEGVSKIDQIEKGNIVSEATTFGTIQIPPSGHPMILLADAQTTGGYPTMGTIHSEDVWRISQLPPGGKIHFNRYNQFS